MKGHKKGTVKTLETLINEKSHCWGKGESCQNAVFAVATGDGVSNYNFGCLGRNYAAVKS